MCGAGLPIYWNHMPQSGVQLKLDRSGGIALFCGETEIGQGSDSVVAAITAEILGVDLQDIRLCVADTDLTPVDLGSYSSRVTLMAGNAAVQAAEKARDLIAMAVGDRFEIPTERLAFSNRQVFDVEDPDSGISFQEAVIIAEAKFGTLGTVGSYTPPRSPGRYRGAGVGPSPTYSYTAAVIEVDVDPETGLRAGPGCPGRPEIFIRGTAPWRSCSPYSYGARRRVGGSDYDVLRRLREVRTRRDR